MSGFNYDPTTILYMVSMTLTFLFIVFGVIANKNPDIKGMNWWLYFSLFLAIETVGSLFSDFRNELSFSPVLNFIGSSSYLFLMVGCCKFAEIKMWKPLPFIFMTVFVIFTLNVNIFNIGPEGQIYFGAFFISISILFSIFALIAIDKVQYEIEKNFLLILLILHLLIYTSWGFTDLELFLGQRGYYTFSLMIIYTIDTMVIIGLLLLSLARRRFQLAEENNKYFITQVELAKAVSATNITNKEKMRFLEQISRDLQSPVSSILKCNQKLNVVELNSGQKILSSSIEQAAKKIRELINCLVDLSNLETGKISVKMNKVGFEEILKDELPTLQALVLPFSIKLILNPLNVAAQQSGKILVDRAIIMKALCYILKSMTTLNIDSGEIQIEYGTFDANIYRILIRENAAASNNDNYIEKTTDIILIIVKSFVEIMDGEIVFDYSKKNGNQFIIDFPLQD